MVKLADVKPKVGKDNVKLEELLPMLKKSPGKWVTVRMLPIDVLPVKRHWVNILAGKDKREVTIPKICVSFDPKTEGNRKGKHCPYDDLAGGPGNGEIFYLANVIDRSAQEDRPAKAGKPTKEERKTGFKDPSSDTWTPVVIERITSSLAKKIQSLKELNKHKMKDGKKKTFDVSDPKYGCDINLKYDPKASGADKYQVTLGDKSKLTEEELGYLTHELNESILDALGRETPEEAQKELDRMEIVGDDEVEDDEDDDSRSLGKKKDKKAGKKSKKSKDEDEDDEDEDEDEDDDSKSKKSKSKKSKKSKDEDDEDEDEDDEDEDDEDEDDEDEDEDDEDEDEDDSKSKKKGKQSKKSKDEDEDEDDEDEDDEDEDEDDEDEDDEDEDEDDSKSKKKGKSKVDSKKKSKKSKDEDDEDEDEDDEDDEDEDEDDEDEDDEDEDEDDSKSKKKGKQSKKSSKKDDKKSSKKDDKKSKSKKSKKSKGDDDIPF